MTGSVDDVDLCIAPPDGRVFGQDGDAFFTFQLVGVHHPIHEFFVGSERPGLLEHGVNQRRLAVVNVGDDRDITAI